MLINLLCSMFYVLRFREFQIAGGLVRMNLYKKKGNKEKLRNVAKRNHHLSKKVVYVPKERRRLLLSVCLLIIYMIVMYQFSLYMILCYNIYI